MLVNVGYKKLMKRYGLWFVMCIWILAPYLLIQKIEARPIWWVSESKLDQLIQVNTLAVYPYFSFYVFVLLAISCVVDKAYIQFVKATALCALVSHLVFMFFPTGVSRTDVSVEYAPWLYQWLVSWDAPRNVLPSFHASISVLSACMLGRGKKCALLRVGAWIWVVVIFWSALAIRQHHVLDLLSGALLGFVCWLMPSYLKVKNRF